MFAEDGVERIRRKVTPVRVVSISWGQGRGHKAMAGPGALKRIKEIRRQEKNQQKAEDREKRRREKAERGRQRDGAEDPDIAGIIPGPQPPLEI